MSDELFKMDEIQQLKRVMDFQKKISVMYTDNATGKVCFFEDKHKQIFDDLKAFYTSYLKCEDKLLLNSKNSTADNFASSLMHLIKASPILNEKSEDRGREEDIVNLAKQLLKKLEARPSMYWQDHTLFNRNTNQRIVDPLLQVAAIIEGSQERIEKLKESGAKRRGLFDGIRTLWESGGYPELNDKPLDAIILTTIALYLTDQAYREDDSQELHDKKSEKWQWHKTGLYIAKSGSTEYKDASKFLKTK